MFPGNTAIILATLCVGFAAICVITEWRGLPVLRAISKLSASSAFVAITVVNGASGSAYGRLMLLAFALSWVGDALLLSPKSIFLLAGMALFLLAHAAFGAAFFSQPFEIRWFIGSVAVLAMAAAALLRWLWPHLDDIYRVAVPAYLLIILAMVSLAIAVSMSSGSVLPAAGAFAFAVSDVAVARDRFIANEVVNKTWGLPLYYVAQVLLAMSVLSYH